MKRNPRLRWITWGPAAMLMVAVFLPGSLVAGPESLVVSMNDQPGGQSYGRWAAEWWQWGLGVPGATNPLIDFTGENCAQRQVDDVWFLAGFLGDPGPLVRECTIPEGKSLFFPFINSGYFAFLDEPPENTTEEFMREQARCEYPVEIMLEIDGEEVKKDFTKFFTGATGSQSPLFNVQLPPENITGLGPDIIPELVFHPSAEEGYYVFLRPLDPGEHTIHWVASGCGDPEFTQDITYVLTVGDDDSAKDAAESAPTGTNVNLLRSGIRVPPDLRH